MSHTPTPVNVINVTGAWSAGNYQRTTGYTYIFYWQGSTNNDSVPRSILYNNTTRKWEDNGNAVPHTFDGASATTTAANPQTVNGYTSSGSLVWSFTNPYYDANYVPGPNVTYGPSHGALPTSSGFTVYNLNFTKVGDREYKISYQQKNAPPNSYTVRVGVYSPSLYASQNIDYTVTTAATNQTINIKSGSLYGTGPAAASTTPQNGDYIQMRFMDFDAKLGSAGTTINQGLIFQQWQYLYNNLTATFTPSSGVPGTVFNFTLTGSDDTYASSSTATLTDPSGTVTTFTKNTDGQFHDSVTNVTSIEGDYTVEHPTGVNRGTSTYDNSGPPIVVNNNGGRKRRYPIISTNLFDRQRSIYSIGNTHKDETLF